MLYIGWVILNFGILCLFLFYCLVAGRVIRQAMGVGPLLLILFGLVALRSGPSASPVAPISKKPAVILTEPAERLFAPVADFYIASITLITTYQPNHVCSNDVRPNGLWFGCRWQTTSVQTDLAGPRLRYTITGVLLWKLLGLSLYRQHKVLTGSVALR